MSLWPGCRLVLVLMLVLVLLVMLVLVSVSVLAAPLLHTRLCVFHTLR
jgi:hypothetical protein